MRRAVALALVTLAGCPSPAADSSSSSERTGDGDGGVVPPTAACNGDASRCITGTVSTTSIKAPVTAAKVELFKLFPTGSTAPAKTMTLAKDGRFAFSNVDPWSHYFVRAVAKLGDGATATSIAALRGPLKNGDDASVVVAPVQLEVLETLSGGARKLSYASAHVYDPATGLELPDATVVFSSNAQPSVPMPYAMNAGGGRSYFVQFAAPVAGDTGFKITTTHAAFGAAPIVWNLTPEAPRFSAPQLTAPAENAIVPVNQPIVATWQASEADYAIVDLFQKNGAQYLGRYSSPASLAPDVTTVTIPATAITTPGAYLLNVDAAQSGCQVAPSQGCTYLLQPAGADLTAQ